MCSPSNNRNLLSYHVTRRYANVKLYSKYIYGIPAHANITRIPGLDVMKIDEGNKLWLLGWDGVDSVGTFVTPIQVKNNGEEARINHFMDTMRTLFLYSGMTPDVPNLWKFFTDRGIGTPRHTLSYTNDFFKHITAHRDSFSQFTAAAAAIAFPTAAIKSTGSPSAVIIAYTHNPCRIMELQFERVTMRALVHTETKTGPEHEEEIITFFTTMRDVFAYASMRPSLLEMWIFFTYPTLNAATHTLPFPDAYLDYLISNRERYRQFTKAAAKSAFPKAHIRDTKHPNAVVLEHANAPDSLMALLFQRGNMHVRTHPVLADDEVGGTAYALKNDKQDKKGKQIFHTFPKNTTRAMLRIADLLVSEFFFSPTANHHPDPCHETSII